MRRAGEVAFSATDAGTCLSHGLETCQSVWACPVCSGMISRRRAEELKHVLDSARSLGWRVHLLTMTIPHHAAMDLEPQSRLVAKAWQSLLRGKAWVKVKRSLAIEGYVRALEVTTGRNGWHPHMHVILLTRYTLPETLTDRELESLDAAALELVGATRDARAATERRDDWRRGADFLEGEAPGEERDGESLEREALRVSAKRPPESIEGLTLWLWRRWSRAVERLGQKAPSFRNGVRIDGAEKAASYLTKLGLASEITRADAKRGRGAHLTHWQVLADTKSPRISERRRRYRRAQWQEFVDATKGRRQLTWSRGLRKRFGLGEDLDDEEIAREELTKAQWVLRIDGQTFDAYVGRRPKAQRALERAVLAGDTEGVATVLGASHGWSLIKADAATIEALFGAPVERRNEGPASELEPGTAICRDNRTGEVIDPGDHDKARRRAKSWRHNKADARAEASTRALAATLATTRAKHDRDAWQNPG